MGGAFETGSNRNFFTEIGFSEEEVDLRVLETFNTIFFGPD